MCLVPPSSVVAECFEDVFLDSDCEVVDLQSFSFSKKRPLFGTVFQETMRYEGSPGKAPPLTRRRKMPSTPQQNSHLSHDELQWQAEMEVQGSFWSAREMTVIATMEIHLDKSDELRVEARELELLMGSEDSEVSLMYILTKASRRGSSIFEIFSASGSDHLVKYQEQKVAQQERLQRRARTDCDKRRRLLD